MMRSLAFLGLAVMLGAVGDTAAAGSRRQVGDSRVFATVPEPGHLEGLAVNGDTVFSGTTGDAVAFATGVKTQSAIFAFDRATGALRSTLHVEGERLGSDAPLNGIAGLAFDAAGRLYAADLQGRILRFALARGTPRQEVYATIPDLPSCARLPAAAGCSPTLDDRTPLPNDIVFDAAGNLYVTDTWQATIFRVPPGGGPAQVWFQSERIDGLFGANGIRVDPDGTFVYFAVTRDRAETSWVFRLPLAATPSESDLEAVVSWPPRARPVAPAGADGIAFGASGLLYVVLGGDEEIAALDVTTGAERRFASPLLHNPASPAFDDRNRRLLVTNHAFFDTDPSRWTIVDLYLDDREAPLARPAVP
jgi:sugar lactone lactonase YvrE